jgi:hypothetical protein
MSTPSTPIVDKLGSSSEEVTVISKEIPDINVIDEEALSKNAIYERIQRRGKLS